MKRDIFGLFLLFFTFLILPPLLVWRWQVAEETIGLSNRLTLSSMPLDLTILHIVLVICISLLAWEFTDHEIKEKQDIEDRIRKLEGKK